jgi:predicted RNase H-like HicB family nuclease
MKYTYPIVITHEPDASTKAPQYIVRIPDFDALTQGESITDAIEMGQDLLSILVVQYEDEKRELPEVSSFTDLSEQFSGSVVSLVIADSDHYRQMYQSIACNRVRKTAHGALNCF